MWAAAAPGTEGAATSSAWAAAAAATTTWQQQQICGIICWLSDGGCCIQMRCDASLHWIQWAATMLEDKSQTSSMRMINAEHVGGFHLFASVWRRSWIGFHDPSEIESETEMKQNSVRIKYSTCIYIVTFNIEFIWREFVRSNIIATITYWNLLLTLSFND